MSNLPAYLKRDGKIFVSSLISGLLLGVAGTVYLAVYELGDPVTAAFMFGFGLLMILVFGFKLFTGAVNYTIDQKFGDLPYYFWFLSIIWLGNFIGTWLFGMMVRQTRMVHLVERAAQMGAVKIGDPSMLSVFFLSVGCGALVYIAVDSFRRTEIPIVLRILIVGLCVSIFILSGFEHVVADMFYFCCAGYFAPGSSVALTTLKYLMIMTLGNGVGGTALHALRKIC